YALPLSYARLPSGEGEIPIGAGGFKKEMWFLVEKLAQGGGAAPGPPRDLKKDEDEGAVRVNVEG
ncbi:MAG: hypothetical protein ABJL92_14425, partial [Sulfitobacter sp.]|uniref:hypothetical protein n=1 Tax=Sulfitobacter sp. TaxID=1903071 RepID=UPI00329818CB